MNNIRKLTMLTQALASSDIQRRPYNRSGLRKAAIFIRPSLGFGALSIFNLIIEPGGPGQPKFSPTEEVEKVFLFTLPG